MNVDWQTGVRDPTRLAAVQRAVALGTGPEDAFDRLTELAAELIGVSRVCVTLIDANDTTAKSMIGFPEDSPRSAPVAATFCRFVVGSGRPLVVDDSRRDPRTADDPAIDIFDAAAWVGYPVVDADGAVLGTFCLMDSRPHEWTPRDLHIIATLAKAASSEILLRIAQAETTALHQQIEALTAASAHDRAALATHLTQFTAPDDPNARFAHELLSWLADPHVEP